MIPIIADTMVWYKDLPKVDPDYRLIGTGINMQEICTTKNWHRGPRGIGLPVKACKNLWANCRGQHMRYFLNPFEYFLHVAGKQRTRNTYRHSYPYSQIVPFIANGIHANLDAFQKEMDRVDSGLEDWVSEMNQKKDRMTSFSGITKEGLRTVVRTDICNFVLVGTDPRYQGENFQQNQGYFNRDLEALSAKIDWERVYFFEEIYLDWTYDNLFPASNTPPPISDNDFFDLWNMVYVAPGQKYLTEEVQWLRRIKKLELENYIQIPGINI